MQVLGNLNEAMSIILADDYEIPIGKIQYQ